MNKLICNKCGSEIISKDDLVVEAIRIKTVRGVGYNLAGTINLFCKKCFQGERNIIRSVNFQSISFKGIYKNILWRKIYILYFSVIFLTFASANLIYNNVNYLEMIIVGLVLFVIILFSIFDIRKLTKVVNFLNKNNKKLCQK